MCINSRTSYQANKTEFCFQFVPDFLKTKMEEKINAISNKLSLENEEEQNNLNLTNVK